MLLVIALTLIVAFLSWNAVHAFSRHEISVTDSEYKSSDGATVIEFIDSACAVISRDGAREAYNVVVIDNNIIVAPHDGCVG